MTEPEPPESLDHLLSRWSQETPPAPDSVAPEVWRRIGRSRRTAPARQLSWLERLHAAFARPSFAAAFVAMCVLLGLFLAEARSSRQQAEYGARIAQDYLKLVDPLLADSDQHPAKAP